MVVARMRTTAARVAGCSFLVASGLYLTAVGLAHAQAEKPKVAFGLVLKSAFAWPVFVASHKGLFDQQGVAVEITTTGSSAKTAQQLIAGAINIGEAGQVDYIRAIDKGAGLKIVASEVARPPYSLIAGKEYKSLAQLKGKSVIVGGANDVTRYFAQVMLRSVGLSEGQYDFTYSGSSPNRLAAVVNGSAAAAVLGQPFDFVGVGQGLNNLGAVYDFFPDFSFAGYAVEIGWAEKNRDALVRLLRADLMAIRWLYDPQNRSEAIAILSKETGANADDTGKTYDLYMNKIKPFANDGRISKSGFQKVLEAMVALGDLREPVPPYTKFVDDSFIAAAQ
jgi:NitT/TauT family transport system substrate-binding protein